jgi:hypothetical protein
MTSFTAKDEWLCVSFASSFLCGKILTAEEYRSGYTAELSFGNFQVLLQIKTPGYQPGVCCTIIS